MAQRGQKLIIGQRLRVLRSSLGLTQAQMANQMGVSPSYITLVEEDQRPASAKFLIKLAQVYDMNISELAPNQNVQLASDFEAALKDPAFELSKLNKSEIEAVLQSSPKIAQGIVRLQEKYSALLVSGKSEASLLADRNKVEALGQISRPVEIVRDWFYANKNYIDSIDRAAENLSIEMGLDRAEPHLAMTERLLSHSIKVRIIPADVMAGSLRRFDPHNKSLLLSELLGQQSRRFQIGVLIARLEYDQLIEKGISDANIDDTDADTKSLLTVTLANYFSAALLMIVFSL